MEMRKLAILGAALQSIGLSKSEITAPIIATSSKANKPYRSDGLFTPEPVIITRQIRRAMERKCGRYR